MSLEYGIRQALRFYEKLEHQNRFRRGGDAKVFKHIAPINYILPFQIKRAAGLFPITGLKYISVKDGSEIDLVGSLGSNQTDKFSFQNYDYLVHYGDEVHTATIPEGEYYLEVTDSVNTWYSEILDIRNFNAADLSLSDCVLTKITYWDTCDVADMFYRTVEYGGGLGAKQYKNIIYLDIDVGKPAYEYSEEGEEDGLGNFSPDYKKLEKQYLLQGVYPEYFVDALALIPLHVGGSGVIEILTNKGYTGTVDRFTVTPEWEGDLGVWAKTDLIFSTEFIVKTNCCGALDAPLTRCLRGGYEFVATILEGSDDYNNFEYTDASDGTTKIPLVDNDKVLIEFLTGEKLLRSYNEGGGTYDTFPIINTVGDELIDLNELNGTNLSNATYYFYSGISTIGFTQDPVITSESLDVQSGKRKLEGYTYDDALLEVYAVGSFGVTLIGLVEGSVFNDGGFLYDIQPFSTGIYIKAVGLTCSLGDSDTYDYPFGGVGVGGIGSTFIVG